MCDATIGNVDDAVAYVLSATPRLATVTNLTVISFSFLEGARKAFISAPNVTEGTREVADEYCIACEHMTAVRLHLLLDKDEKGVSFQTVYHRLKLPEVAEALAQHMGDDPFQPQHIEDDVRHSINQFLCVYRAVDWGDLSWTPDTFSQSGHCPPEQKATNKNDNPRRAADPHRCGESPFRKSRSVPVK